MCNLLFVIVTYMIDKNCNELLLNNTTGLHMVKTNVRHLCNFKIVHYSQHDL